MINKSFFSSQLSLKKQGFFLAMFVWLAIISISFVINFYHLKNTISEFALIEAKASFNKDFVYRRWSSKHGGVYVEPKEDTPPNPYLSHIPDRDVVTTSGKQLTLINPAYMTRQVHELGLEQYGVKGHITSLNPIRPGNAPDEWEKKVLQILETGAQKEFSEISIINGEKYMRFMRAMVTEKSCLKCHASQGYKEGDNRGGISVSVPFALYEKNIINHIKISFVIHISVALLVLAGMFYWWRRLEEADKKIQKNLINLNTAQSIGKIGNWEIDHASGNTYWSEEIYRIFELNPDFSEASYYCFLSLTHPDDRERVNKTYTDSLKNRTPNNIIFRLLLNGDKIKFVNARCETTFDISGNPILSIGTIQDITEQENANNALLESETRFRVIFEQAALGIGLANPEGCVIRVNKKLCEIVGYSNEELLTKNLRDIIHPDDFVKGFFYMQLVISGEKEKFYENIRFIRKDGELVWIKVTASLVRKEDGAPDYFIGILEDITQKRLIEIALKESEKRYRIVADYTSDWEFWLDPNNNFVYVSPSCKDITGYEAGEFYAKPSLMYDIIHPDDRSVFDEHRCVLDRDKSQKINFRIIARDKSITWINHSCLPMFDENNNFIGMRGSNRDITELKRNEDFLSSRLFLMEHAVSHKLEDVMQMVLDKAEELTLSKIGFFHFLEEDQQTLSLQAWSSNTLKNMCSTEGKGLHYSIEKAGVWADCVREKTPIIHNDYQSLPYKKGLPPGHAPIIREMIAPIFRGEKIVAVIGVGNKDFNYDEKDLNILHDFGNIIWNIIHEKKLENEKEALENQLRQSQKMEALGTLSGGIAHDFNNILSIIFGNAELSKTMIEPHSPIQKYLNTILIAGNRAKDLIQQILTFSRKLDKERKPLEIYLIIKEFVKMLRSSIPTTIEINNDIDPNSGIILADPTQIHQILINLCTNASYSMREKGGVLSIKLKPFIISELDSFENGLIISPGNYVMLEVSDTGAGIDKKILDKIFEPYFTTKPMGEGTGLGLAVVHGIVKSYGGHISVDTEKDQGTTFKVYFPLVESESIKDETKIKTPPPRGIENILLVDDEVEIVDLTKTILEYLGYNVLDFTSSTLALKAFSKAPHSFDLVITDMTMPEMTGIDLSREMHAIRPDIPVILFTGFSQLVDKEKSGALGLSAYLTKPVSMTELADTVRNVLDSRKG